MNTMEMEDVRDKVHKVFRQAEKIVEEKKSEQEKINDFLDVVLKYQKKFNDSTKKISELREILIEYFDKHDSIESYQGLSPEINKLIKQGKIIYVYFKKKKKIGEALKSSLSEFNYAINNIKEVNNDKELKYIKIISNEKFRKAVSAL